MTGPPPPGPESGGGRLPRRISIRDLPAPVREFNTTETTLMMSAPQNADQKVYTEKYGCSKNPTK